MKTIHTLLLIIGLFVAGNCLSQIKPVPISSVDSVMKHDPKPVLLLLSTTWCQYCQMQKLQLRKNKAFREAASSFHYVEFDAETREQVTFQGKSYEFVPTGKNLGTHALATLLNGPHRLSYPTWIVLDKNYKKLFQHGAVLLPKQVNELLHSLKTIENQ